MDLSHILWRPVDLPPNYWPASPTSWLYLIKGERGANQNTWGYRRVDDNLVEKTYVILKRL